MYVHESLADRHIDETCIRNIDGTHGEIYPNGRFRIFS